MADNRRQTTVNSPHSSAVAELAFWNLKLCLDKGKKADKHKRLSKTVK